MSPNYRKPQHLCCHRLDGGFCYPTSGAGEYPSNGGVEGRASHSHVMWYNGAVILLMNKAREFSRDVWTFVLSQADVHPRKAGERCLFEF